MNAVMLCSLASMFGLYGIYHSQSTTIYKTTTSILSGLMVVVAIEYVSKKWYFFQPHKTHKLNGIRTSCIHNRSGLPNHLGYFNNNTCTTMNSSDSVVHIKHSSPTLLTTANVIDVSNNTITNDKSSVQYTTTLVQCIVLGVLYGIVRVGFT